MRLRALITPGPGLDRIGRAALLLAPLFLTHGRAAADICISVDAILFLLRSWLVRDAAWLRERWVRIALAWWAWVVFCSLRQLGQPHALASLAQGVVLIRLIVFAAACEHWLLTDRPTRRGLFWVLAFVTGYIAANCLWQYATGTNFYGAPRFIDGTLTGPYVHPRAAAPLSRLLFPVLLPAALLVLGMPDLARTRPLRIARATGAAAIGAAGLALVVLIGQRMPLLLCALGLVVVALPIRRLRLACLALVLAVPALVALTAIVSPPSFHHLWVKFSHQIDHFSSSPYGLIAARATEMVRQNPWFGLGADGYRFDCAEPRYFHGWNGGDGLGAWAGVCVQHPHNHYLQAAVQAGWPGLALFCATVLAWLAAAARGLTRDRRPDPLRVGLLAALVMQEWPIASASAFANLPLGGWFFLLLGFALALARPTSSAATARTARPAPCPTPPPP